MWTHTVAVLHMNKRLIIYGTEAGNGQRQVSEWGQRGTAQQSHFFFLTFFYFILHPLTLMPRLEPSFKTLGAFYNEL